MANGTAARFQSSRPAICVAGQDTAALAEGLLSLLIEENTSGLYRCEALIGNWGTTGGGTSYLYFDRRILDFGKPFAIKMGSETTLFDGRIMALEANFPEGQSPELNVLAEDRLQDFRMTRRTRAFENVSDSDVMNQIAGEHGIKSNVTVGGGTHKVLAQVNQSDLAFLRQRARAIDAELWMESGSLNASPRTNRIGGSVELTYPNKLREFSVIADLAHQCTSVTVSGWDVASKSAINFEATDSAISGELDGDTSGPGILNSALGQRKESLAHTVPLSSQEAQDYAEAFFRMTARRFVVGRGVADIDTALRVGRYVDLKGLGPLFSGKYYVSEVKHVFDCMKGLRTEFVGERPGLGR